MHPDFEKNGYLVVRNFFDDSTLKIMQQYWNLKWNYINFSEENRKTIDHSLKKGEQITIEDDDVGYSFNFYGDNLMEAIELEYGQKASEILNANLSPTYTYTRIYEKGTPLIPHTDRKSCEISATCPILISDNRSSQICVSNFTKFEVENRPIKLTPEDVKNSGNYSEIHLMPGDIMFYKGCDRYHWRDPIQCDYLIQFFMHFVEAEGKNKDYVFDTRPYMGFPAKYKKNFN